jgi:hypothetical protein
VGVTPEVGGVQLIVLAQSLGIGDAHPVIELGGNIEQWPAVSVILIGRDSRSGILLVETEVTLYVY